MNRFTFTPCLLFLLTLSSCLTSRQYYASIQEIGACEHQCNLEMSEFLSSYKEVFTKMNYNTKVILDQCSLNSDFKWDEDKFEGTTYTGNTDSLFKAPSAEILECMLKKMTDNQVELTAFLEAYLNKQQELEYCLAECKQFHQVD